MEIRKKMPITSQVPVPPDVSNQELAGVGIALFDRVKILCWNRYFPEAMGLPGKGFSRDDFLDRIHPEDRPDVLRRMEQLFNGDKSGFLFDLKAGPEGKNRFFRAAMQIMDNEGSPAVHLTLTAAVHPSEPARAARINELKLYHEDRLAALGTMAAGIAHELNQPLNTIRVVTDGFLYGRVEGWPLEQEELFEGLEMISRQVMRMDKVIRNVRNFAREGHGQAAENVSVNEAIENVFTMIGKQVEAHGIRVERDLDPELPMIRTTLNELEQVVMNLIVNARQALDETSRPQKVLRIHTRSEGGVVFIEVSDNATGIPEEFLEKILDPFFTTKASGKGTGLGLSICQSIVSKFGGGIEVFNNESGGATFVVRAPATGEVQ